MAALAFALAVAVGLVMVPAGAAQADPIPTDPTVWKEMYLPYVIAPSPVCADVINGSTSEGAGLQVFHCHGYASNGGAQRFRFVNLGDNRYWVVNAQSARCVSASVFDVTHMGQLFQTTCAAASWMEWLLVPSLFDPEGFFFVNQAFTQYCMAAANNQGDHAIMTMNTCANNAAFGPLVQLEDWRLG
jgi:hypothetical protein